jgi:predicted O-methyltransferase YrrM
LKAAGNQREIPGVDLSVDQQLQLFHALAPYLSDCCLPIRETKTFRYHLDNPNFSYGDALVLQAMMRYYKPAHVIEVGSGYSSALMLDINDSYLEGRTMFTLIEPDARLVRSLMRPLDTRHALLEMPVQEVPLSLFQTLQAGDFLFLDSTHVLKTGSDVDHLLSRVLPCLSPGVFVHFHDIFWPFEYPEDWIVGGRCWNEIYAVRLFLQFNSAFRMVMFLPMLARTHQSIIEQLAPSVLANPGGGLWLLRER